MADKKKSFDVAWGLENGYTEQEIRDYISENGLRADSSGVPAWRSKQAMAALSNAGPGGVVTNPAAADESGGRLRGFQVPVEATHWTDPLPSAMGFGGSLLGGAGAGAPGAIALGGAAQGLGKAINLKARQQAGLPTPSGPEATSAIAREALMGAGAELTGRAATGIVGLAGRGLNTRAFSDPVAARTSIENRAVLGPKWGPWKSAQEVSDIGMARHGANIERLLAAGEQAGIEIDPIGFANVLRRRVAEAKINKVSDPGAYRYWRQRLAIWERNHGMTTVLGPNGPVTVGQKKMLPLREVNSIKMQNAQQAKQLYEARHSAAGLNRRASLDEQYARDLADWSRGELDAALPGPSKGKGIADENAHYNEYRRMGKSARAVENPKPGQVPSDAAPAHARVYNQKVSLLPSLPPEVASRVAMGLTSAPSVFGTRVGPWMVDLGMSTGITRNYQPPTQPGESGLSPELEQLINRNTNRNLRR